MSTHPQARKIIDAVKRLLKAKGLKYRDVARHLGLSESGVKRFMSEMDIDLDRLLAIADLLEISLQDILTESNLASELRFSHQQEKFFAEHISHLCFFLELNNGKSVEEIASAHGLTPNSIATYLSELEELNLVRIDNNGKPLLLVSGSPIKWDDRGPIGQLYSHYFISAMCERAFDHLQQSSRLNLWTGSRRLAKRHWKKFKQDIDSVLESYRALSSAAQDDDEEMQYMFIADLWHDPFFDKIENLPTYQPFSKREKLV